MDLKINRFFIFAALLIVLILSVSSPVSSVDYSSTWEMGTTGTFFVFYSGTTVSEQFVIYDTDVATKHWVKKETKEKLDLVPGQSLAILGEDDDGTVFGFAKLDVLDDYFVQPYIVDYTLENPEWVKYGEKVKNNEQFFSNPYLYGPIWSDSEQEGKGIEFHNYYVSSPSGVNLYQTIRKNFQTWRTKGQAQQKTTCTAISECLAEIDIKLIKDLKLS